jgi:hypothetical protein
LPASGGAGAGPPPKTTASASWRLTLPWVSPGWGGLVGDMGHRKGQLRVLGSPSALHTKEPRTRGPPGGAGSPRTRFFVWRKSLDTYLGVLKPDYGAPGPIGNILATATPDAGRAWAPAGKMGGDMWLWALGQQTERIKSLRPSLLLNPRLYCYYKH